MIGTFLNLILWKSTPLSIASDLFSWFKFISSRTCLVAQNGGKEPTCQCRRHKSPRFDPWVRKISWKKKPGNPFQYSCLENSMERGACQVTVHRVTETWTQLKQLMALNTYNFNYLYFCCKIFLNLWVFSDVLKIVWIRRKAIVTRIIFFSSLLSFTHGTFY